MKILFSLNKKQFYIKIGKKEFELRKWLSFAERHNLQKDYKVFKMKFINLIYRK